MLLLLTCCSTAHTARTAAVQEWQM